MIVVAEVTAVEEESAGASGELEGEAPEDLRLEVREAEVAIAGGEVSEALSEGVHGGVSAGHAASEGGESLAGDLRRDGVHGGEEVGDEFASERPRSCVVRVAD